MNEQIEIRRVRESNTDSSRTPTLGTQHTYWCFTYNNYNTEQCLMLVNILKNECKWYIFQEETGDNGTIHLQGTLCFLKRKRLTELKKINDKIHWEITKSISASMAYCSKYATRTGKVFSMGVDIPEPIKVQEPYGWQLEVLNIIKQEPDERTIHWFWDSKGNIGKSTLCKYLVVKHDAIILSGKSTDMFHRLINVKKIYIVIVDIPRKGQEYVNISAIESIKNGLIYSGKYEGSQLVFNCPHVIIFSNAPPDYRSMSEDRWHVVNIRGEENIDIDDLE